MLVAMLRYQVALPWSKERLDPMDFLMKWEPASQAKSPEDLSRKLLAWGSAQSRGK